MRDKIESFDGRNIFYPGCLFGFGIEADKETIKIVDSVGQTASIIPKCVLEQE